MPNIPFQKTAGDIYQQAKSIAAMYPSKINLRGMVGNLLEGHDKSGGDKDQILDVVNELAQAFLCYDRQVDEDLPEGMIEDNIKAEHISVDEIVDAFRIALLENLPDE